MIGYQLFAPEGIGTIQPGADLARILAYSFESDGMTLQDGDILLLAHKIVSKAEGRVQRLSDVSPSKQALSLARKTGKDAPLVELILEESGEILCAQKGLLLCRHRLGFVCADAAVDRSNAGDGMAVLLPIHPDASAARIRRALEARFRCRLGVIICDTHGRSFREGASGIAIGASGVQLLKSYIGEADRDGRIMHSSVEAVGDELAAAATLLMEQSGAGRPVVLIRGLSLLGEDTAAVTIRSMERDVAITALKKSKKKRVELHE